MGWMLRKSKKIGPFRVTATKSGLSLSGGVPGARVSVNSKGEVRRTVSVPGAGIYNTKKIGKVGKKQEAAAPRQMTNREIIVASFQAGTEAERAEEFNNYVRDRNAVLREVYLTVSKLRGSEYAAQFALDYDAYMSEWVASAA